MDKAFYHIPDGIIDCYGVNRNVTHLKHLFIFLIFFENLPIIAVTTNKNQVRCTTISSA